MKLFSKKYNQAQTWLDTFKAREEKKDVVLELPQKNDLGVFEAVVLPKPQTVFTYEDKGHSPEESKKIEELYAELLKKPLYPVLTMG